jgi:hypothetical protein
MKLLMVRLKFLDCEGQQTLHCHEHTCVEPLGFHAPMYRQQADQCTAGSLCNCQQLCLPQAALLAEDKHLQLRNSCQCCS